MGKGSFGRACLSLLSYYVEDNKFGWKQPLMMVGLMFSVGVMRYLGVSDQRLVYACFVLLSMLLMFIALVIALVKLKVYTRSSEKEYGDLYTSVLFFFIFLADLVYVYVESMKL